MEYKKEKLPSTNINWLITIYLNPSRKPLFTMTYED